MLAGGRDIERHLAMQIVGRRDGDHLDIGLFQHLAIVGEDSRDPVAFREFRGVTRRRRSDRDNFRFFRHDLKGSGVNIRLKLRSDDSDLHFSRVVA